MTFSLLQQLNTPSGVVSKTISTTCAASASLEAETVPIATDTLINIAFPYATIKAYILLATCNCTVETNSSSAPSQSISLTADVPLVWITGGAGTNLFTADVTKIYVTAAAAGTLTIQVGYDPTP